MLSCVLRPLMKLDWVGAIRFGIMLFSRIVTHFVTNLYMTLQSEIGRNSEIKVGFCTFGMRHKWASPRFVSKLQLRNASWIKSKSDFDNDVQPFWKKIACNPSGPGALYGFVAHTTSFNSFKPTMLHSLLASSDVRQIWNLETARQCSLLF